MATIKITVVGFETLSILTRYMAEFIGEERALDLADSLIDTAQRTVGSRPPSCPVCHELELIGVTDYQQLTIENYKVLYRYNEHGEIACVTAFLRHRQSAQELLIGYSLLR